MGSVRNPAELLGEDRNGHAEEHSADERQEKMGGLETGDDPISGPPSWPVLAEEVLYGLPGEVVKAVMPHTEADSVALLVSLLASFGNALGQGAYFKVGPTLHHLKLFVALLGETSKARKGTSWDPIKELLSEVDPA